MDPWRRIAPFEDTSIKTYAAKLNKHAACLVPGSRRPGAEKYSMSDMDSTTLVSVGLSDLILRGGMQ